MTNFISEDNSLTLGYVDLKNDMVAVYINEDYCIFKFKGDVRFFKDGIGCEFSWVDYEHNIELELVPVLSEIADLNNLVYNEESIIEFIADKMFKEKEKGNE